MADPPLCSCTNRHADSDTKHSDHVMSAVAYAFDDYRHERENTETHDLLVVVAAAVELALALVVAGTMLVTVINPPPLCELTCVVSCVVVGVVLVELVDELLLLRLVLVADVDVGVVEVERDVDVGVEDVEVGVVVGVEVVVGVVDVDVGVVDVEVGVVDVGVVADGDEDLFRQAKADAG